MTAHEPYRCYLLTNYIKGSAAPAASRTKGNIGPPATQSAHFRFTCHTAGTCITAAYGHVRVRYSDVFGTAPALGTDLHAIFDCADCQDQLAHALYTMTKFREHCLSRPQGGVVNVGMTGAADCVMKMKS